MCLFSIQISFFKFFKVYFIYFERDRDSGGGAERKGEGENPKQALSPMRGSNSWNHEIMIWAETNSWMLNRLSHPRAPPSKSLECRIYLTLLPFSFFKKVCLFTLRERIPHCQRGARCEAQTNEPWTWLEPKSRVWCLTDWATQAPLFCHFKN